MHIEPQQLELFVSKTARLAKVEKALERGEFQVAATLAGEIMQVFPIAEAQYLHAQFSSSKSPLQLSTNTEEAADWALHPEELIDKSRLTLALWTALGRGLFLRTAQNAQQQGAVLVRGRPVGWYWLQAGEIARAITELEAAVCQNVCVGFSLTMLGNIHLQEGSVVGGREYYRRAFCEEPSRALSDHIRDSLVQELWDECHELALDFPEQWIPLVGYSADLFRLPEEPQGQGACLEFHTALLEGRRRGNSIEFRRRMKMLAPLLFEKLRDAGKL